MEIAKAVVLTGRSPDDRPWPSVRSMPKALVPVANRPMLFHNLEALRRAGVLEATIAVEADAAAAIRRAVGDGSDWDLGVRYVEFRPDMRMEHALGLTRDFVGDEPVLVQRAGALLRERMHPFIAAFASERLDALALRLPAGPDAKVPLDGSWFLSPRAVSILMKASARDPDPLARVHAEGGHVRVQDVDGCLPCQGGQDTLLEANRRMLEELAPDVEPACLERSEIQGPAIVHPTARLENSLVRGPAIIGPRTRLRDAYVGPYTSIGADVVMEGAEIEHSIVFSSAEIRYVGARLESSVIGQGARVSRSFRTPGAVRLSIGDGAEVTLS
jgi:glucose-1-phosphate thymidylyltransferase